ncbi:hypothetical protein tloyanaT_07510 [Thalassotalea loyana]|uniref:Uncharacterized protein n=1 Tax=Thalassotalea loyana TaxID=280483 RepID=A0ABQ6HAN7_9GAMM|nr:hypothetical protein [Thalassotalea loyana]GLX84499.1 hypothetical protein tloyanaT_07510 [Thalassotalea loyana]
MKVKTKKIISYTAAFLIIGGLAFYASMEEYQKENMANFISQTFS